jgi:UDP-3-O-[3-hydroxymyristoyl] glucosamine N-acyltransferase
MEKIKEFIDIYELATWLGGTAHGENVRVYDVSGLDDAGEGHITWVENKKALQKAAGTGVGALILAEKLFSEEKDSIKIPCIAIQNPRHAYARTLSLFYRRVMPPRGVAPTAVIGQNVTLHQDISVGDFAVVGDGSIIGKGATVFPHVYIGKNVEIGEDSIIFPFAVLHNRTKVGRRAIIHSGAIIGGDGFGFVEAGGGREKIPQVGSVELGDDVELGANVTIDRATTGVTFVGSGTKIDNLVQIGHNCKLGKNCVMVSQSGIAGSTHFGDNVTFAAQAGTVPHICIGSNTVVAGRGGVTHDLPGNMVYSGFPAKPHRDALKIEAAVQRLPHLIKTLKELESRIGLLEEKLSR